MAREVRLVLAYADPGAKARGAACWALASADTLYQPLWLESGSVAGPEPATGGEASPGVVSPADAGAPAAGGGVAGETRELALLALQGAGLLPDEATTDHLALWPLALPARGRGRAFGCCVLHALADPDRLVAARPESVEPVARCLAAAVAASVKAGPGEGRGHWLGVWREGSALVFGWFVGREPLHAAGVASVEALAEEARLALAGLELRGFDLAPACLLVFGDAIEPAQAADLARAFTVTPPAGAAVDAGGVGRAVPAGEGEGEPPAGAAAAMPVRMLPALDASPVAARGPDAPALPVPGCGLVPPALAAARSRDRRQEWWLSAVTGALAVVLLGFGVWVWQVRSVERATAALEQELLALAPELAEVGAVRGLWGPMERAMDPNATPVELFHRVQQLFPAEGIRLTEFEFTPERLLVAGEASSTAHALRLRDALQESDGLADYRWTFPPPEILEDGRATFVAEGAARRGG